MSKLVNLEYLESYDIDSVQQVVDNCFLKLEAEKLFKDIKKVLLKVCLPTDVYPDSALTTHPSIVRSLVNALSKQGIKCLVADCPYGVYSNTFLDKV